MRSELDGRLESQLKEVRDRYNARLSEEIAKCREGAAQAVESRVAEEAAEAGVARGAALDKARGEGATRLSQQVPFSGFGG